MLAICITLCVCGSGRNLPTPLYGCISDQEQSMVRVSQLLGRTIQATKLQVETCAPWQVGKWQPPSIHPSIHLSSNSFHPLVLHPLLLWTDVWCLSCNPLTYFFFSHHNWTVFNGISKVSHLPLRVSFQYKLSFQDWTYSSEDFWVGNNEAWDVSNATLWDSPVKQAFGQGR